MSAEESKKKEAAGAAEGAVKKAAGAYVSFSATVGGFDFDATGDRIYLRAPDGLKVLAAIEFGGQETGRS